MQRASSCFWLVVFIGCGDWLAPVNVAATTCQSDHDCAATFFCIEGRCLRSSEPRCGDGKVQSERGELCDDGNHDDDDACPSACQPARCGDGIRRDDLGVDDEGFEACDDGNTLGDDACTDLCLVARCGDGRRRAGLSAGEPGYEACDDGNSDPSDACTTACTVARCGDGFERRDLIPEHPDYEACDDGNDDDEDRCNNACQETSCGDGHVQTSTDETCDDGNQNDQDACTNACAPARCGDGIWRLDLLPSEAGYEACDDGNDVNEDPCSNTCVRARCGDGWVLQGSERCDDGNLIDDDDCSNTCGVGYAEVVGGQHHFCARIETGQVRCWGKNNQGALGDGTQVHRRQPTLVVGIETAVSIRAGAFSGCALLADGALWCWGWGFGPTPRDAAPGHRWQKLVAFHGTGRILAIDDAGLAWSVTGQGRERAAAVPQDFEQLVVAGSGTNAHYCGLDAEQQLWCWGENGQGQVGDGTTEDREQPTRINLAGVEQVVVGSLFSCALVSGGQVFCWGWWQGSNTPGDLTRPRMVDGVEGVTKLWASAGAGWLAARLGDGSLAIAQGNHSPWGLQTVDGIQGVQSFDFSVNSYCALDATRQLWCWGHGDYGALGFGTPFRRQPHRVAGIPPAQSVALGDEHSCALLRDGTVRCWGADGLGQLGDGLQGHLIGDAPVTVAGLNQVVQLSAGDNKTCARTEQGSLHCWGSGYLGGGTSTTATDPRPIPGVSGSLEVAVGGRHGCFVDSDRQLLCWGSNNRGNVGDGTRVNRLSPVVIDGMTSIRRVAAGSTHTCAVGGEGQVWCWGWNNGGPLGNEVDEHALSPLLIEPRTIAGEVYELPPVAALAASYYSTCALLQESAGVVCWGGQSSTYGTQGIGSWNYGFAPVSDLGGTALQIASSYGANCARLEGGALRCWGENEGGQVGDGTNIGQNRPVSVVDLPPIIDVDGGYRHLCAVAEDGAVYCWGWNCSNQLGDGYSGCKQDTPVLIETH